MTERQLQFRVGLFVIVTSTILGAIVFAFGQFRSFWEPRYTVAVHFESAPGVFVDSPVRMSGVKIGTVSDVVFDQRRGGVTVLVGIKQKYQLRSDAEARLVRSLLGDSTIEFTPGVHEVPLKADTLLEGHLPADPMEIVQDLNSSLTETLTSFDETSREWRQVAKNVNVLFDTDRGQLDEVVERAAAALEKLTLTMDTAHQTLSNVNQVIENPEHQKSLHETITALPRLVGETYQTIATMRHTMELIDGNLNNLNAATAPLAERSNSIVTKLDTSLSHIENLSGELNQFVQLAMKEDGSLKRFASDPDLYRNLNRSATLLTVLLQNLEPISQDLRIFTDKIARHPEVIGVSGAIKGSSGLKDASEGARQTTQQPRSGLFRR